MARTVAEIYQGIVDEVNASTYLTGASTSQTAVWRMFAGIVAIAIFVHESLWDIFRTDVEEYVNSSLPGTVRWYHEETLKFQYGDTLIYSNRKFQYAVIDETKKIIKRCAVAEVGGQVRIKICKETNGVPEPLSSAEKSAYELYINQVKFAGTNIAVINYQPDLLRIELDVYYDALVMQNDGSLISDPAVFPVVDAINAYVKNIVYGGVFVNSKMVDSVQATPGVQDILISTIEAQAHGASAWTTVTQNYNFVAGYAVIDNLDITYHPNVI